MRSTGTSDWLDREPPPRVLTVAGLRWSVSESRVYDRRVRAELLFQCDTLTMRIRTYPANWRSLGDDELWDLAWTRH